jgi:hypothetical protein
MSMSRQATRIRNEGGPHKPRALGPYGWGPSSWGPSGWGAADCLSLAAAPTFAIMALLTAVLGGGPLDVLCSAAPHASPLSGMVPMYVLMSAFHAAPWLKLISRQPTAGRS